MTAKAPISQRQFLTQVKAARNILRNVVRNWIIGVTKDDDIEGCLMVALSYLPDDNVPIDLLGGRKYLRSINAGPFEKATRLRLEEFVSETDEALKLAQEAKAPETDAEAGQPVIHEDNARTEFAGEPVAPEYEAQDASHAHPTAEDMVLEDHPAEEGPVLAEAIADPAPPEDEVSQPKGDKPQHTVEELAHALKAKWEEGKDINAVFSEAEEELNKDKQEEPARDEPSSAEEDEPVTAPEGEPDDKVQFAVPVRPKEEHPPVVEEAPGEEAPAVVDTAPEEAPLASEEEVTTTPEETTESDNAEQEADRKDTSPKPKQEETFPDPISFGEFTSLYFSRFPDMSTYDFAKRYGLKESDVWSVMTNPTATCSMKMSPAKKEKEARRTMKDFPALTIVDLEHLFGTPLPMFDVGEHDQPVKTEYTATKADVASEPEGEAGTVPEPAPAPAEPAPKKEKVLPVRASLGKKIHRYVGDHPDMSDDELGVVFSLSADTIRQVVDYFSA